MRMGHLAYCVMRQGELSDQTLVAAEAQAVFLSL